MPCDHCDRNYTNEVPKHLRAYGREGDYCSESCRAEAEPNAYGTN